MQNITQKITIQDCWIDFELSRSGVVGCDTEYGAKWIAELPENIAIGRNEVELLLEEWKKSGLCLNISITKKVLTTK